MDVDGYKCKINIIGKSNLPDFRLFKVFLWGEDHNVDSDGDSCNPASRTWTYLYLKSRENEDEYFVVSRIKKDSLIFEIKSSNEFIAFRIGYFFVKETDGQIDYNNKTYGIEFFKDKLGDDFDLLKALQRVDISIWRKSSLENPYPN